MANEFRVKNGLIIDEVNSGAGVLTIADSNISSDDGSIEVTVVDGQSVTLGKTGSHANIVVTPHGTAGSEKITLTNTSGTADDAIKLTSVAGGVTVHAGNDSLIIDADGTDDDALNIDSAGGMDVDIAGEISIESTSNSIEIGGALADGQSLSLGKAGAAEMVLTPHGTAGSENIRITNTAGTGNDAVDIEAAAGGITLDAAGDIRLDFGGGDLLFLDDGANVGSFANATGKLYINSGTTRVIQFGGNSDASQTNVIGDMTVNGTTQTGTSSNVFQVNARNTLDDTVEVRLYNSTESPTTISNVGNVLVLDNGNNEFDGAQGVVMTIGSSANTNNNTESWYMGTAANLGDCWGIGYIDQKHWDTSTFAGSSGCVTDVEQWLLRVTTDGKMTIGKPAGQGSVDTGPMNKLQVNHTSADGDNGILILRANTTTADGALLGSIGFDSTDGAVPSSNLEASAFIAAYATEDHSGTEKGGKLVLGISRVNDNADTTSFPILGVNSSSATTGWVEIGNGAAGPGELRILEDTDDGSNYAAIRAQAMSANYTMILPAAQGTAGQVLDIASVSGTEITLAWDDVSSGGATALNGLSDVSYSSGDLTITSLDTIVSGAIVHDSSGKITLDSDTGDIVFSDGGTEQLAFDLDGTAGDIIVQLKVNGDDLVFNQYDGTTVLTLGDDTSVTVATDLKVGDDLSLTSDSAVINMGAGNDATFTHDGTTGLTIAATPITITSTGDLTLDVSTDIVLDAGGGDVFFKDDGTTFGSATNTSGNLIIKSGTTTALTFSGANVTAAGTYSGGGTMTTGGNIVIPDAGYIGSASDTDAIQIEADGDIVFSQDVAITGTLTVNGTTTTVNSTTITVDDPIFTLGGDTAPGSDDNKDRGIEFRYYDSQARIGFFGYDDSAGVFTGFTAASNSSEVFSGTVMPATFGAIVGTTGTFSGAVSGTTGTYSGILKTDDTTDATSTTDGSLQTDGGLSIAKDAIIGNDLYLLSDSAVLGLGAGKDFKITHDGTTGATLSGNPITITSAGAATWSTSSGALTVTSAAALELDGTTITLDSAGDITLEAGGADVIFSDDGTAYGSITNSSGDMQIKAAASKGIELRSNTDLVFLIEDDAPSGAGTANVFQFTTEATTGTDYSNVDAEMEPVVCQYTSGSTNLGRTEYGRVTASDNAAGVIFQFAATDFAIAEVIIHLTDTVTDQVNKMLICADGGGGTAVNYSNYSVLYSDGSTELGTFTATMSSGTVSVNIDADDNDVCTYAVTFLK